MGMPGVDGATARLLAEQAVQRLGELHAWVPAGQAERTLSEPPDDGGFVSRAALLEGIGNLAGLSRDGLPSARLLDGLTAIAERAPLSTRATVAVHADCHWGNWLACDRGVTALLDFEWARFGEPADDWFFLARFSGPHREVVLDAIAGATATPGETLRAECEVREASYLVSDISLGLQRPGPPSPRTADRLQGLADLIIGRSWWRTAG
jgi:Ser/Thr protein kinase RdoA (MazF antagonist)